LPGAFAGDFAGAGAGDFAGAAAGDLVASGVVAAGDAAGATTGAATGATGAGAGVAGTGVGCGAVSGTLSKVEREPVTCGNDINNAIKKNETAPPMVIFCSNVAVPRAPKAVLFTPPENSAPASALPGCSSTAMIKTMQAKIKIPYST
jgi:hypothetical protein